jgi:hypothetical protein
LKSGSFDEFKTSAFFILKSESFFWKISFIGTYINLNATIAVISGREKREK